jgi:hypothetical protein
MSMSMAEQRLIKDIELKLIELEGRTWQLEKILEKLTEQRKPGRPKREAVRAGNSSGN